MATDVEHDRTETGHHEQEHIDVRHPTPALYVRVAAALFVLTAMEFSTYYIDFGPSHGPLLLGLMAIKFVLVAGFFMHLKFDTRLFTRLMAVGLVGAIVLYGVTFASIVEIPAGIGLD